MAGDLDVTAATWGSASLLLVSGDDIDGATGYGWGSQVAKNTGWLYYQPKHLASNTATITAGDDCNISIGRGYFPKGTYSIYAYADADGAPEGTGYVKFDGTIVASWVDANPATGQLVGWSTTTGGWYAVTVTGSADASDIIVVAGLSYRAGSYGSA